MAREDFVLDDAGYSPEKFYTKATDTKGHSTNLRVHVPPEFGSRVSALIAARQFPDYRTLGDFVRDSMYHRLYALEHALNPYEVPDGLAMIAVREEAIRIREMLAAAESTAEDVEQSVRKLRDSGSEAEAKALVASALASVPDYPPAKRVYLRQMRQKFGAWITDGVTTDGEGVSS